MANDEVIVHTLDNPVTTLPGGGAGGDPWIYRVDGTKYQFLAIAGMNYLYASDSSGVTVTFHAAAIPGAGLANALSTMIDSVTIKVPGHTIVVGLNSMTLDGVAQAGITAAPITIASGSVWWHVEPVTPGKRVDVKWGAWWIAVIQDVGTNRVTAQ